MLLYRRNIRLTIVKIQIIPNVFIYLSSAAFQMRIKSRKVSNTRNILLGLCWKKI